MAIFHCHKLTSWGVSRASLFVTCAVNIPRSIVNSLKPVLEHPVCTCGAHMVWSRVRLSMLNDPQRNTLLLKALHQVCGPHHHCHGQVICVPIYTLCCGRSSTVLHTLWSECSNALFVLLQLVKEHRKVLVLSDGSLLPFMAASLGASKVHGWEECASGDV